MIKTFSNLFLRPLITEKNEKMRAFSKYVFEVPLQANKIMVRKAVEKLYKVKPVSIKIIRLKGKPVRYGKTFGRTKIRKKAIVTLKKGDKIEF